MTATALLERTPLAVDTSIGGLEEILGKPLAEDAAETLGYTALKVKRGRRQLAELLAKMDANPFSADSVEAYKQAMVKATSTRWIWFTETVASLIAALGLVLFMLSFGPAVLGWMISANLGTGAILVCVGSGIIFGFMTNTSLGLATKWQAVPLKGYTGAIPEFVIQRAIEIKKALPDAEFSIHHLTRRKVVLDPFLVVRYDGEEHFIDVWDEPTFKADRKA